jgi:hypothetical protein
MTSAKSPRYQALRDAGWEISSVDSRYGFIWLIDPKRIPREITATEMEETLTMVRACAGNDDPGLLEKVEELRVKLQQRLSRAARAGLLPPPDATIPDGLVQ